MCVMARRFLGQSEAYGTLLPFILPCLRFTSAKMFENWNPSVLTDILFIRYKSLYAGAPDGAFDWELRLSRDKERTHL